MKVFCSTQRFRRPLMGKPPVPPGTKDRPFHSDVEGSPEVLLAEHTVVPQRASTIRSKAVLNAVFLFTHMSEHQMLCDVVNLRRVQANRCLNLRGVMSLLHALFLISSGYP